MSATGGWRVLALALVDDSDVADPLGVVAASAAMARRSNLALHALLLGGRVGEALGREAMAAGASVVTCASHPSLGMPPQPAELAIAAVEAFERLGLAGERVLVLLPAGAVGEELAARLAARLDGVALGRCRDVVLSGGGAVAYRASFGGRAEVELQASSHRLFAAIRGAKRSAGASNAGALETLELSAALPAVEAEFVEPGDRPARLEGAKVVVSGGRGIGGPEGFAVLEALAAALGGVVGGSLPAVDAGWVPVMRQVGQSGRFVTPEVYVAVGISGTPQHLAGIGPDTRIVAINNDAEAAIFQSAEAGIVGDWREVVPALTEALKASQ